MPCFTPHPSLLLLLTLLLSLSFFSLSTAAKTSSFHSLRVPGFFFFFFTFPCPFSKFWFFWKGCDLFVFLFSGCFSDGVEGGGEGEYQKVLPWKTRRSMAEDAPSNTSLILAQRRTTRKDPLDNFNRYTGGWNISNRHYIAVGSYLTFNNHHSWLFFFFFSKSCFLWVSFVSVYGLNIWINLARKQEDKIFFICMS